MMAQRHLVVAFLTSALCAGAAQGATVEWDGTITEGNSFTVGMIVSGTIDMLGLVALTPGAPFEAPVASNINQATWGLTAQNDASMPTIAALSGPLTSFGGTNFLRFDLTFAADVTDTFEIDFVFFNSDMQNTTFRGYWDGQFSFSNIGAQSQYSHDFFEVSPTAIPLPTTAGLGLAGLAGLAIRRRRAA
jgi:MYXO-CTERM domain-containing protein